ncbi:hypothetical protein ACLF3G_28960 [Falsiroseomonas sp. HC035]|uniref:hypothetical protein n=1 Tax=Falsiroseomonas sp. HC035 TaxID=3390999 RepID=UPI003D314D14
MADALATLRPMAVCRDVTAEHPPRRPHWPWRGLVRSAPPPPSGAAPDFDALLRSLLVL